MQNAKSAKVYVMESAGRVKIGRSADPLGRCRTLRSAGAVDIRLVHSTDERSDSSYVESAAHRLLADKHRGGEWFDVGAQEAIDAIQSAIGIVDGRRVEFAAQRMRAKCRGCRPAKLRKWVVRINGSRRTVALSMRIDPELKAQLEQLAKLDKRTLSNYVETLLARECEGFAG